MMYAWMAVWSLMALAMPSLAAIMSKQVGPTEQGELQGALASVGGLTSVVAPPFLTTLFAWTTGSAPPAVNRAFGWLTGSSAPVYFPGAAFFAAGIFLSLAALWFSQLRGLHAPNEREAAKPAVEEAEEGVA
jgi:DHA1 family tetracycline resistance protein-like MFS transporter